MNRYKLFLAGSALLWALSGCSDREDQLERRIAELEAQLDDVHSELNLVQSEVDILKNKISDLTSVADEFFDRDWRAVVARVKDAIDDVESAADDVESAVDDALNVLNK